MSPVPLTADCILQQTIANVKQIKDIEDRIEPLSGILASPVGDQDTDEKARRTTLRKFVFPFQSCTSTFLNQLVTCRTLSGIIIKLRPLSEQHGVVKFLNNVDHASILNGFVRDLSNAVTYYQVRGTIAQHELSNVSIQRNIYDNTKRISEETKKADKNAPTIIVRRSFRVTLLWLETEAIAREPWTWSC